MGCKKCGANVPNRIVVDGKQRILHRKHCLDCVPFVSEKTKQIMYDKEAVPTADEIQCGICSKMFKLKANNAGKFSKKCGSCTVNDRRFALKQKLRDLYGAKCSECGYDECQQALAFHHIDPTTKSFVLSSNFCRSWEVLKAEAAKCVLLCANCHIKLHNTK